MKPKKKSDGLEVRYIGQEANLAPVMPVPNLNDKLEPTQKEKAPNVKK